MQNYLQQKDVFGSDEDLKDEFNDARDVMESLVKEYHACESPNYIEWGMAQRAGAAFGEAGQ